MKSSIFATTALVATAGVAAADVTLGGSANAGLRYTGAGDAFLHYEIDIDINAAGETENGLSFGASLDLDENAGSTDPEVFVSGAFGKVTIGAVDIATDGLGLPDLGFDGIGMDDDVEALRNAGSADVVYSHSIAGVSVTLSYGVGGTAGADASEGDMGLLLGYKFDAFSIEAGIATDDQTSNRGMGVELGYSANGITVNALWASQDVKVGTDTSGYGLYVGYTMDAITVGASYADTDVAGDGEDYGLGFSYNLGGGLRVVGGVGSIDRPGAAARADVWDLGLTMSF